MNTGRAEEGYVTIRQATAEDVPTVLIAANETVAEDRWITRGPGQEYTEDDFLQDLGVPDRSLIVATVENQIVGLIRLRPFDGRVHLGMMVKRGHRHQGIGGLLLDAAIEWGREQGLDRLYLSVFSHNAPGIALYRRKRFQDIEYKPAYSVRQSGDAWDLIVMARDLDDANEKESA
jgi:ribosomal-protein-alanine N-acetyltransferase